MSCWLRARSLEGIEMGISRVISGVISGVIAGVIASDFLDFTFPEFFLCCRRSYLFLLFPSFSLLCGIPGGEGDEVEAVTKAFEGR